MSTLDSYQYICTLTARQYCSSGRERDAGRLYESAVAKKNEKRGA